MRIRYRISFLNLFFISLLFNSGVIAQIARDRLNVLRDCEVLFGYLEAQDWKPKGQTLRQALGIPEFFEPRIANRTQPSEPIKKAIQFTMNYKPDGFYGPQRSSLAHHRAYVLRAFFAEIARAYPLWSARVYRDSNGEGDFFFVGSGTHYVRVAYPSGEITWGSDHYKFEETSN